MDIKALVDRATGLAREQSERLPKQVRDVVQKVPGLRPETPATAPKRGAKRPASKTKA